jgi:hypothetical protein
MIHDKQLKAQQIEQEWRAEGQIFGYALLMCLACFCVGLGIGMRTAIPEYNDAYDVRMMSAIGLCLTLITVYGLSIRSFIHSSGSTNISTYVMIGVLWAYSILWMVV